MRTVYKTLLADDERPVRTYTRHVLQQYPQVFELLAEAGSGKEAVEQIDTLKPDLVFLDIEMPDLDGFHVLEQLQYRPMIIFLTAYDHYAIKAFEENSIDYLLKPLLPERLEQSIQRLDRQYPLWLAGKAGLSTEQISSLISRAAAPAQLRGTITVKQGNKMLLLSLDEVVAFQGKEKYTAVRTQDNREFLDNRTLAELERQLPAHFLRIQKGAIVNTRHIREIRKHFNNRFNFYLDDQAGTVLRSGHTYAEQIRVALAL